MSKSCEFDIHEWAVMERFAHSRSTPTERDELLAAIHGSGAFRKFRHVIQQLGIQDDWYGEYTSEEFRAALAKRIYGNEIAGKLESGQAGRPETVLAFEHPSLPAP